MVEFRDVVKKYTDPGEALGRDPDTGDVTGLEPGTDVDPVEVVTDPAAQAALSATFGFPPAWKPGLLYSAGGVPATWAPPVNLLIFRDLWVPPTGGVIDLIATEVTTEAEGASLRLCIYGADDDGQPGGSPIVATGPLDASTSGTKQVPLPDVALPGGIVWVGAVVQGASPTIRTLTGASPMVGMDGTSNAGAGRYRTGVTGELPDPLITNGASTTYAPRVFVRAAS